MKPRNGRRLDILYCLAVMAAIIAIAAVRHHEPVVVDYRDYIATDTTRYHYTDTLPSPADSVPAVSKRRKVTKHATHRQRTSTPTKHRDALSEPIPRTDTLP